MILYDFDTQLLQETMEKIVEGWGGGVKIFDFYVQFFC